MHTNPMTAFEYLYEIDFQLTHEHAGHNSKDEDSHQYLHFRVADNNLLLELSSSTEVINSIDCSLIPRTQPWLLGMASLRGQLLPLIDLQAYWFDTAPAKKLKSKRVISTKAGSIIIGLVVDQVFGVVNSADLDEKEVLKNDWQDVVRKTLSAAYSGNEINYGKFELAKMISEGKFSSMQSMI
jgi:twitching motility protein PilI